MPPWNSPRPHQGIINGKFQFQLANLAGARTSAEIAAAIDYICRFEWRNDLKAIEFKANWELTKEEAHWLKTSITKAEHHENAAKAHRTAAEHHGKGDHAKGREHANPAKQHSQTAHPGSRNNGLRPGLPRAFSYRTLLHSPAFEETRVGRVLLNVSGIALFCSIDFALPLSRVSV
jgi:hypothetical protein